MDVSVLRTQAAKVLFCRINEFCLMQTVPYTELSLETV